MVAEPWLLKLSNQMSSNFKHALQLDSSKPLKSTKINNLHKIPSTIGILSFEIANVMSKTVHLHKSLTNSEILNLKSEILKSDGVKTLISSDETYLLQLALSEKLDDLSFIAGVVSRLGNKCTVPQLQGFQHVFNDIITGAINVSELGFLVKDMDAMVRKMERYVNSTARLYSEMEVLNELEAAAKKFQQNQHEESRKVFEQKVIWQQQDVSHLKDVSLWNQTYDKIVEMLARTVCTLYARICLVFVDTISRRDMFSNSTVSVATANENFHSCRSLSQVSGQIDVCSVKSGFSNSGFEKKAVGVKPRAEPKKGEFSLFKGDDFNFACGRLFAECLNIRSPVSKFDDFDDGSVRKGDDRSSQISGSCSVSSSVRKDGTNYSGFQSRIPMISEQRRVKNNVMSGFKSSPKNRLTVQAPPNTIGGSALALHYANVIIVIEKLLQYPHLVGEEARDDLYQMLPTSLRLALKLSLKSYVKDLAIYDAPLAHDWKDRLDEILGWLAPLAHNMIRWQNERNFEQQQIVSRTNVLLLQTLYFADRKKTETAICELLVGLNYICRYEHQQNALLDCASSFDFDDCMEWQTQY
ncbi:protein PSK SIMULATOR 3-like [Rutidosis leptorrhynchoides]|uniref:protein PSK SIMULATOR 3-like n=1 Tax=Rutidosis leptorrhynchoides TaxID=125765 RepID=UPI003A994A85